MFGCIRHSKVAETHNLWVPPVLYHDVPTGSDSRIIMHSNSFRLHYGCQSNVCSIHLLS